MENKSFIRKFGSSIVQTIFLLNALLLLLSYASPFVSPISIWWFTLLGLAYPVFLIVLMIAILFSFWNKWKIKYVLLLILLIGIPIHSRFFGLKLSGSKKEDTITFRLMSYNVRLFNLYEQLEDPNKEIKAHILDLFREVSADVLCVQEYINDKNTPSHVSRKEIQDVGKFINYGEHIVWTHRKRDFGIATFSRFPIVHKGEVKNKLDDRIFSIYTDVILPEGDTVRIYNVHLESIRLQKEEYEVFDPSTELDESKRRGIFNLIRKIKHAYQPRVMQVESLIEHLEASPYLVMVCGDFNEPPISFVYQQFHNLLKDAFIQTSFGVGRTYAGRIPAGRIDYIFHNEIIQPQSFSIDHKTYSDHYAIWGDFYITPLISEE